VTRYQEALNKLAIELEQRRHAIGVIVGASELVGVHGLHLTEQEVGELPEKVVQALLVLGVGWDEMAEFYEGGTS
jgi:hypothetical protein